MRVVALATLLLGLAAVARAEDSAADRLRRSGSWVPDDAPTPSLPGYRRGEYVEPPAEYYTTPYPAYHSAPMLPLLAPSPPAMSLPAYGR